MSFIPKNVNVDVSIGESSRQSHSIDKTVPFGSFLKCNSSQLTDTAQINNKVPVKSCSDAKSISSQNSKFGYINPTQVKFL